MEEEGGDIEQGYNRVNCRKLKDHLLERLERKMRGRLDGLKIGSSSIMVITAAIARRVRKTRVVRLRLLRSAPLIDGRDG